MKDLELLNKLALDAGAAGVPALAAIDDLNRRISALESVESVFSDGTLEEIERLAIEKRMSGIEIHQRGSKKNKSSIAQSLGIERSTLDRKLKRYGL